MESLFLSPFLAFPLAVSCFSSRRFLIFLTVCLDSRPWTHVGGGVDAKFTIFDTQFLGFDTKNHRFVLSEGLGGGGVVRFSIEFSTELSTHVCLTVD